MGELALVVFVGENPWWINARSISVDDTNNKVYNKGKQIADIVNHMECNCYYCFFFFGKEREGSMGIIFRCTSCSWDCLWNFTYPTLNNHNEEKTIKFSFSLQGNCALQKAHVIKYQLIYHVGLFYFTITIDIGMGIFVEIFSRFYLKWVCWYLNICPVFKTRIEKIFKNHV